LNWNSLTDTKQIDNIVDLSHHRPQVIFKHSTSCSISSISKSRFENSGDSLSSADVYYLDLLSYRTVSNNIAEKLGVHHESPQVIVIINGEVTYDESHLDISVEDIIEHFNFINN
jgi:bacillithiol system protein YtxJ